MEHAREIALQRALVLLKAAGVAYAIITPEGNRFGDLEVVERRSTQRQRTGFDYKAVYADQIKDMQPGDCKHFKLPDNAPANITLENLRSAVTAACTSLWGKESYISTVNRDSGEVELLRVV